MKVLKYLLGTVLALFVLTGIAIAVVFATVDPNNYRDEIAQKVKETTGREFAINGDIKLSIYPWLGVAINDVELGNAEGFEPQNMTEMKTAGVSVKLLPLLRKEVVVDNLRLEGAELYLSRDAQGKTNWADLTAGNETTASSDESSPSSGSPLSKIDISGIKLIDTRIEWNDAQAGSKQVIEVQSLTTGRIGENVEFPLEFQARLTNNSPPSTIDLDTSADITLKLADREMPWLAAKNFDTTVTVAGDGIPNGTQTISLSANVTTDLEAQTLDVTELLFKALNLEVQGNMTGSQIIDAPKFAANIDVPEFSLRELLTDLQPDYVAPADETALTSVSLNAKVAATAEQADLQKLVVKLDDSTLKGSARVGPFSNPRIIFDLVIDQLNADRYNPPASSGEETAESSESAESGYDREVVNAIKIPAESLRALNLQGKAAIESLQVAKLKMQQANLTINASNGIVKIAPLQAKLYGGAINLALTLDATKDAVAMNLQQQLTDVKAGPLQQDMLGEIHATGIARFVTNLTGKGATVGALRQSLNGNIDFSFKDGALQKVNIAQSIRKARAAFRKETLSADAQATQQTDFSELTGTIKIVNGLATNNDLAMAAPALRLSGSGTANLFTDALDYRAKPVIVQTSTGAGGKSADDIRGIPVPVKCTNTIMAPECKIDIRAALEAAAKERVDDEIDKQTDRLKERAAEKLGDKAPAAKELFDLFRNKNQ